MSKPIIAIVGRPNVGKSMLFNKIIGRRLSIVEDTPGVTRDRIYGESDWQGRKFTLIDTGGIEPRTDNQILAFMRSQAQIAIDNATVIVFLCDIKTGMTASDQEVASMLQRCGKPVVLAVNKVDQGQSPDIYEFYNLGLGDPIAVSAVHGHGTGDLLDACVQYFPPEDEEEEDSDFGFGSISASGSGALGSSSGFNGPVLHTGSSANKQEVVLFRPGSFNDTSKAADDLRDHKAVIVNMENVDKAMARRVVDFLSGCVYALDGDVKKIAQSAYLFCPHNMEISGDLETLQAEVENYI